MTNPMTQCAIAGIGQTEFSTNSGRSELRVACDAILAALADAGLEAKDVDGIVTIEPPLLPLAPGEHAQCPQQRRICKFHPVFPRSGPVLVNSGTGVAFCHLCCFLVKECNPVSFLGF